MFDYEDRTVNSLKELVLHGSFGRLRGYGYL